MVFKRRGHGYKKDEARAIKSRSSTVSKVTADQDSTPVLQNTTKLPTFHQKNIADKITITTGGYYEIYKRSTTCFWDWMKQTLPYSSITMVKDLREGVDAILEHNTASLDSISLIPVVVPKEIMEELSLSIKYRKLLTENRFGEAGGNMAHQYMIEILQYCHSVLRFSKQIARVVISDGNAQDEREQSCNDEIGGRFKSLILEDDDDDDEGGDGHSEIDQENHNSIEENIRNHKFPAFNPPKNLEETIAIEEVLINGNDRFQAIALIQTMDGLMGAVEGNYGILKNTLRKQGIYGENTSTIKLLMECAAASNMAIESVFVAENSLQTNHPHLSSFYHVLALVFLTKHVADVEKQIDTAKLDREPHMALNFVAQIIQCSFHNNGDNNIFGKVKRFVRKSGIKLAALESLAHSINLTTSLETQLRPEEKANAQMNHLMLERVGLRPHMWLQKSEYIGGDRCILNTQKIVQKLMDIVQDRKLVGKPGFWGPNFDEKNGRATRIRGDLDEPFAGSIMPELIEICKNAPFHCLPKSSHLITVPYLLQRHINGDRTGPVPIALSFGLHAMLTSVFILQGNGNLAHIATCAKQSYNGLFAQLDQLSEPSKKPQNSPNFYHNVCMFKNVVNFAKPPPREYDYQEDFIDPAVAEKLAFWNPLIGGEYMLYGTYMCSIGLGSATVDSLGQLRFTLHLYNALKQCNSSLDIPFLQNIDDVFAKTKAVWAGGRPKKGSYCKNFLMAMRQGSNLTRDPQKILPEEYSASYRRLVQQIFSDEGDEDVADYMVRNDKKVGNNRHGVLFDLLTRVNMTRDSMDEDKVSVLPINFTAVGCILLEFINSLAEHMGWNIIVDETIKKYPKEIRSRKTIGGEQMRDTSFNTSNLNLKYQGVAHLWSIMLSRLDKDTDDNADACADAENNNNIADADKAATFMMNFFRNISRKRYVFFFEKEENPKPRHRNPLEGSYPHGRTGKTMQDPLRGFCHFKYSKGGEPDVRVVKPGKYTSYLPLMNGMDCSSPYTEGSKLKRKSSGKYRHIASYSLDELIDLGWDGAMYTSTRGRHEAIGHYVPFIIGYDSDADDEYEPIDIEAGKRAGVIGLPPEENGLYLEITNAHNKGQGPLLGVIKNTV